MNNWRSTVHEAHHLRRGHLVHVHLLLLIHKLRGWSNLVLSYLILSKLMGFARGRVLRSLRAITPHVERVVHDPFGDSVRHKLLMLILLYLILKFLDRLFLISFIIIYV